MQYGIEYDHGTAPKTKSTAQEVSFRIRHKDGAIVGPDIDWLIEQIEYAIQPNYTIKSKKTHYNKPTEDEGRD